MEELWREGKRGGGKRGGTFVVRSQKSEIVSYSCFPEKKYKHETF